MIDDGKERIEITYTCPSCHSRLDKTMEKEYRCPREGIVFPLIFGIPDFRLLESRDKGETERVTALIEKYDDSDYEELSQFYMDCLCNGDHRSNKGYRALHRKWTERTIATLAVQTAKYEHMKIYLARAGIEMPGKGSALELGCGTGGMVCILARRFERILGLDAALDKLILAKKLAEQNACSNATFVCAYAEHLPFPDQVFSFISSQDTIEHVNDQPLTLLEVRRSLQIGGCFYFTVPNRYSLIGPEPHVGVWMVGLWPRRWASYYVKLIKGVPYEGKRLPGYFELSRWLHTCFGSDFCRVYIQPDGALPATSTLGRAYRMFLALPLMRVLVNTVGRLFWGSFSVVCQRR